jgi:hypothetical protein
MAFREIFESASQGDPRDVPAEPLTPRKMVEFPKGTCFSFDEELLHEFLEGGDFTPRGMNDEVATLTINGQEHKFSFFDFEMALSNFSEESRSAMLKEPVRTRFELVARMYVQRFPYEESESYPPKDPKEDDLTNCSSRRS